MKKVLVVQTIDSVRRYECRTCGHVARARVRMRTTGGARHSEEAAELATELAVSADTRTALGLVPCPRCGRRDARALISLGLWTLLPAVFFVGIAVWFLPMGGFAQALGVVWLLAAAGAVLVGWRSLGRARDEVRFLDR